VWQLAWIKHLIKKKQRGGVLGVRAPPVFDLNGVFSPAFSAV